MSLNKSKLTLVVLVSMLALTGSVNADVEHRQINSVNSVTYVTDDPWQPEGFVNGIPVPAAYIAVADILVDGQEAESAWEGATEVRVPLQYGNVDEVLIKALYTNDEVFLRVRWPDTTEDRQHHPWVWDSTLDQYVEGPQVEDSVLISFEAGCEWTPSLLGGYVYDFDGWQWLAARSDPLGQALDLNGNVRNRPYRDPNYVTYPSRIVADSWNLKFIDNHDVDMNAEWDQLDRVYLMQPVSTTLHVRAVPDGGLWPDPFVESVNAPGDEPDGESTVFPQFSPLKLEGGAGEVSAKGQWADGYWTVEFRRQLVTPAKNIDDVIFNRLTQFSVHVFDQTDRLDEVSESPRLFLQFLPEETPLIAKDQAP
jgi:hypothetical protein